MRSRLLLPVLTLVAVIAVLGLWLRERAEAGGLQDRFAALARDEHRRAQLQAEGDRLRQELESIPAEPSAASAQAAEPVSAPVAPAWAVGEWTPANAWRDAGRVTPQATASTLLWAAANGDVAKVRELFLFDDSTLARARAWYESLPPGTRLAYATPEDLVAGVTLTQITPERAQLSWLHDDGSDRAIVGLLVSGSRAAPLPLPTGITVVAPPALPDQSRYNVVVLALQRATDGWRVRVPPEAIDALSRRLRVPETK